MKRLVAVATIGIGGLVPAGAHAAAIGISPAKPCYRAGENVSLGGGGFPAGGNVLVDINGVYKGFWRSDPAGNGGAPVRLGTVAARSGIGTTTFLARDQGNPAIAAGAAVRVANVSVRMTPRRGPVGGRLRIRATGLNTGPRLYAHIVRGRSTRTESIGRLRGACGTLSVRKRLFSGRARPGAYSVQFDTRRRYSRSTPVRLIGRLTVYRTASAAG